MERKIRPYLISDEQFYRVPARLRAALARLANAHENDIVLGNSASFGIQLVANGLAWKPGDEVLVPKRTNPRRLGRWRDLMWLQVVSSNLDGARRPT